MPIAEESKWTLLYLNVAQWVSPTRTQGEMAVAASLLQPRETLNEVPCICLPFSNVSHAGILITIVI